jgi:hypothetical protein
MKVNILNHSRAARAMVFGIAFVASIPTFRARADEWDKKTILTVRQTIQVRDTVLDPGRYVLRLLDSQSDRHIVQIFDADQRHLISTVIAIANERLEPAGDSQFTFWETPLGTAKAMRAWFYPGDNVGQEFPYPDHLKELAMANPPAPAPMAATTGAGDQEPGAREETAPAPAAEPAAEPEATTGETRDREAAVAEEATPTTPEPPAAATPEPPAATPTPAEQPPAELPKTASPYPLIGLCGAVLLGFAGLLRLKRSS